VHPLYIRNNIFHNIVAFHNGGAGVYLDVSSTAMVVEGNLVHNVGFSPLHWNVNPGVPMANGTDVPPTTIQDNVFIANREGDYYRDTPAKGGVPVFLWAGYTPAVFKRNVVVVDPSKYQGGGLAGMPDLFSGAPCAQYKNTGGPGIECTWDFLDSFRGNVFDDNVYYNMSGMGTTSTTFPGNCTLPTQPHWRWGEPVSCNGIKQWQALGFDKNSLSDTDPQLDTKFAVTNKAVLALGIKPLKLDDAGPDWTLSPAIDRPSQQPMSASSTCPPAPRAFSRRTGACVSTSNCTAKHCNCSPNTALSGGDCVTAADCVLHGSNSCSNDPRCHSFSVRSDCSTGGGATSAKKWVSFAEGSNSTVPNNQWVVYSRVEGPPTPPPPPTPPMPTPPPSPPLLPKWKPTWNMTRSTMLYTCNHSGFHDPKYAAQVVISRTFHHILSHFPSYSLVLSIILSHTFHHTFSYTLSYAKAIWAQGHPMNSEELLNKQAEMVLAEDAGIPGEQPRVWVYRNTIKALNWFTSVRVKLEDPVYSGWFVRFKNYTGPGSNGSYHVPACTFEKCSGFYHDQEQTPQMGGGSHNGGCKEKCDCGAAPCGEYIFDHRNASFSDWFVNEWMISKETLKHAPAISLGYLDDYMKLSGPSETEGHFIEDTGSTAQEMRDHVAAYLANMRRLEQQLVNNGGFWQGLVDHGEGRGMGRGPQIRPVGKDCYKDCGNKTPAQCISTLREEWCVAEPVPWKSPTSYLMRPPSADVANVSGTQATAQFLLTRGAFAWIGFFDWQTLANWPRPAEWDTDFGMPDGPCAETGNGTGVFARSWSKATVTWDCHTAKGGITMK
jgi:hypothetical protein